MKPTPGIRAGQKHIESHLSQARMCLSAALKEEKFIKGTLYPMRRKCGKPQCKCANSDYRHESWYLSSSDQGKTRIAYVPESDLKRLLALTKKYREFRISRQKLVETFKSIISQVNRLEKVKTIPYPQESQDAGRTRGHRKKGAPD